MILKKLAYLKANKTYKNTLAFHFYSDKYLNEIQGLFMCDVCGIEGLNWKFSCGDKKLEKAYLYKVYVGQVASLKICHLHSIELFTKGERRFLRNHLPLAIKIAQNKSEFSASSSSRSGF